MILDALQRWVWKGSFEPPLARLETSSLEASEGTDLMTAASRALKDLQDNMQALQGAVQRRHAASARGSHDEANAAEEEARRIVRQMLPVLDGLDRLVEYGEKSEKQDEYFLNWLRSVDALRTRLTRTMEGIGLSAIATIGTTVDLELHDVTAVVPAREHPPNTVVAEQQKGYYFRGKLLRDAKVVVAQ